MKNLTIPKVYVETYGCTMNRSDSDLLRGIISSKFTVTNKINESDVVVINSCGVVEFTERKIIKRILELKKAGKKVVVAGCLPRISPRKMREIADGMLSPDNILEINDVINSTLKGEKAIKISLRNLDKASLYGIKRRLKDSTIAIVSISEGCLGKCSFCVTRFARGRLHSFNFDRILEEVKNVVEQGFKEIQLTSQDTGAYGLDKNGKKLPDLLEEIVKIEGNFRVRVGMMNPHHALIILDDLINAYFSEKIYKFIHVPVQSGDNKVLESMRRNHTVEDFIEVVSRFRESFKDVMVATDIIVGYPTENEEAFWKTYELIREIKPDLVNITRFSPRPKTEACKFRDIVSRIKKERSRKLTRLVNEIKEEINKKFVGRKFKVLITKHGKKNTLLSRTDSYRPVILNEGKIGDFLNTKIISSSRTCLLGKIV